MCTGEASVSTIAWPADCRNRRQTAAAGRRTMSRELDPIDVLADMLGEEGFEIADTRLAAVVIVQRLRDSGFSVVPTQPPAVSDSVLLAGMQEVLRLRAEVDRLQDAKRRALQLADQRAREVTELRLEDERL